MDVPKDLQLHHYATNKNKIYTPDMQRIAEKYNLDLDGDWNKELLKHSGRHPDKYHDFVREGMRRAQAEAENNRQEFLNLFEKYVKKPIRDNPDLLYNNGW